MTGPTPQTSTLVDLVLRPNRSLSPVGFWAIMSVLVGFSFIGGLMFWLLGAWPIIGFLGIDVLLVYIAFKASYAGGRAYERVRLFPDRLLVERIHASGKREEFALAPYWLRVEVETAPSEDNRLLLASHGRALVIGAFLSPGERVEVADVLREGLRRLRAPAAGPIPSA